MSDADLLTVVREFDGTMAGLHPVKAAFNRAPVDALVQLAEKFDAEVERLNKLREALKTATPLCRCGEPATVDDRWCRDHSRSQADYEAALEDYRRHVNFYGTAEKAWKKVRKSWFLATQLRMERGDLPSSGTCWAPDCRRETGTDYDGGCFFFCDDHSQASHDTETYPETRMFILYDRSKKRGEEFNAAKQGPCYDWQEYRRTGLGKRFATRAKA